MTLPAFPVTIRTALCHSWHRPYPRRRRFRLHSHRGIFIELVNQQQLPQSSSWHDRQGTEVGSSQDSGAVSQERLPPPWDRKYQPRYPVCPLAALGVLPRCGAWREGAARVSHPGTAASSRSRAYLREADRVFPLKIHLEIMGEAPGQGKQAWLMFSRPKLFHLRDK